MDTNDDLWLYADCEAELIRLKDAIRRIHERSWPAGDDRKGARAATEMWEIADAARNKENF